MNSFLLRNFFPLLYTAMKCDKKEKKQPYSRFSFGRDKSILFVYVLPPTLEEVSMTDFVNAWNKDSFLTYPVGPLGLIAMPGTEEIGEKVNSWLKKWQDHAEESEPGDMRTTPGVERQDFLINVTCPRFGNGEAKGMI